MVDVRIDARGVPKAPVYEEALPVAHRLDVASADVADPTEASQGVSTAGYRRVRFDIDTSGCSGLTALKVQMLLWNPTAGRYFRGATKEFTQAELAANPVPSMQAEVRGATVFLKVVSATATTLSLGVYVTAS